MVLNNTTVSLITKEETGTDAFNRPVTEEVKVTVAGCVVGSPSSEDVANEMNLSGKKIAYVILIPEGDAHDFTDAEVEIAGERYRTIGSPVSSFMNAAILPCNRRIAVERYG